MPQRIHGFESRDAIFRDYTSANEDRQTSVRDRRNHECPPVSRTARSSPSKAGTPSYVRSLD